jgi:hypothetical protein
MRYGGEAVPAGQYWSFSSGEQIHLKENGTLPGDTLN